MGTSKRYAAHYDELAAQRIAESMSENQPTTLGQNAYGPQPITWERGRKPPVWAWISWRDGPATRIPCYVQGYNDRVVIVEFEAKGGLRSVVVWRNAVTRRSPGQAKGGEASASPPR